MLEGASPMIGDADSTHMSRVLNRPNFGNHVCRKEDKPEYSISARVQVAEITRLIISKGETNAGMDVASRKQTKVETDLVHLLPTSDPIDLPEPRSITNCLPPQSPPDGLKPLLDHLKLGLAVPGHYSQQPQPGARREIVDNPSATQEINQNHDGGRNPSYSTITKEIESDHLRCHKERVRIIYPISDSNWISSVQVVPKKFRMIVT
ncbi:hypothetical protein CR513_08672, partial [Mucuna pruriens]